MHITSGLAVSPCVSEALYITSEHDAVESVAYAVCNSASYSPGQGCSLGDGGKNYNMVSVCTG